MRERQMSSPTTSADQSKFEYLTLTLERGESVKEARARLREHTEYGKWELSKSVILYGGRRRYVLKRKVIRVVNTMGIF